ncbi:hypothetical protein BB560_004158 [Smittium megazygosporum]|uniref:NADH-ubiquinone oxidoreductase 12 kDa subunit n=1 Tax=Smittium megazygosporum TaxID=133381 RepID=A0A2T9Z834_9FUNG|nr:hypothetical protein BB560_004845 [Smittium megazygosporum]PVV01424.1 hypothetical protein BB560_004158 [Smittium megazygosporum]
MTEQSEYFSSANKYNYVDRQKIYEKRENVIREQWIKLMETRILREKLEECYETQGDNHIENCRELALRYLDQFPKTEITGWQKAEK